MKAIITIILIINTIFSYSQTEKIDIVTKRQVVGIDKIHNSKITKTEYVFPNKLYNLDYNKNDNSIFFQLRNIKDNKLVNNGIFGIYDLTSNNLKWSKSISYRNYSITQQDNYIFKLKDNGSDRLNYKNGEKIWKVKNHILKIYSSKNIGIGYKWNSATEYSEKLQAINLTQGNVLWTRDIDNEFGWNDLIRIDNSNILVVSSGLHKINLDNGKGWSYNTTTGAYSDSGLKDILFGVTSFAGIISGTFITLPNASNKNVIANISSNVISDNSSYYFSSKQKISKIDKETGKIIWSKYFNEDLPSTSELVNKDSLIVIINKGYAKIGNKHIYYGKPFISAINKETGKQKYLTLIDNTDKISVIDYKINNNKIYVLTEKSIIEFSLSKGTVITELNNDFKITKIINREDIYVQDKDSLLKNINSDILFIFMEKEKCKLVNKSLKIIDFDINKLFVSYQKNNNFIIFQRTDKTYITNLQGEIIAELDILLYNSFIANKTLYNWNNNVFTMINLNNLLKQ